MSGPAEPDRSFFTEVQRFRSPVLWLGLAAGAAINVGIWLSVGSGPSWMIVAPSTAILAVVIALLAFSRLTVEVRGDGVHARFAPFHRDERVFPFEEIVSHAAVDYRPIRDYGGWGLRRGRNGAAYNVSGSRGVLLTLRDGTTLLLGSLRADELDAAIVRAKGAAG